MAFEFAFWAADGAAAEASSRWLCLISPESRREMHFPMGMKAVVLTSCTLGSLRLGRDHVEGEERTYGSNVTARARGLWTYIYMYLGVLELRFT